MYLVAETTLYILTLSTRCCGIYTNARPRLLDLRFDPRGGDARVIHAVRCLVPDSVYACILSRGDALRICAVDFTDCQQYPALAQMFMEEFLAESEDFIFDAGMDDVLALLMDEGQ